MAQTIKLKRSAQSGASGIPSTSDLALGEVAINTYHGKMYIKKDDGNTESIVEVGSTSGDITATELTITGGSDAEDIYINNTSPTLGFTDSNSFSDPNDVYLIRGSSTGKLQFQFKDDSAGTTTQTFLIDQSGNTDIAGTLTSTAVNSGGSIKAVSYTHLTLPTILRV